MLFDKLKVLKLVSSNSHNRDFIKLITFHICIYILNFHQISLLSYNFFNIILMYLLKNTLIRKSTWGLSNIFSSLKTYEIPDLEWRGIQTINHDWLTWLFNVTQPVNLLSMLSFCHWQCWLSSLLESKVEMSHYCNFWLMKSLRKIFYYRKFFPWSPLISELKFRSNVLCRWRYEAKWHQ